MGEREMNKYTPEERRAIILKVMEDLGHEDDPAETYFKEQRRLERGLKKVNKNESVNEQADIIMDELSISEDEPYEVFEDTHKTIKNVLSKEKKAYERKMMHKKGELEKRVPKGVDYV